MKKILISLCITMLICVFSFSSSAATFLLGDVDFNGKVNASDARITLRAAASLQQLSDDKKKIADVDGNGRVNASDARKILRVSARLDGDLGSIEIGGTDTPDENNNALPANEIYKIASEYTVEVTAAGDGFVSTGSGFFYSSDGRVVTNYHVIEGALKITVTDYMGNTFDVKKIIAFDSVMDIAVLAVDEIVTPATLNKKLPKTGDTVYTLGSSTGLTDTFADGIVANPNRVLADYNPSMSYIQMTAPISHGNSGGPLINNRGEVIGINTLTITDGQNINFSIPVKYLDELDYGYPLTMEEFAELAGGGVSGDGYLNVYSDSLHIQPGGSACVMIDAWLPDVESYSLNCSVSDSGVIAYWSDWYEDPSTGMYDTIFLYISAPYAVEDCTITICINEDPSYSADVNLTASANGTNLYEGEFDCPDFGAATGVAAYDFYLNEDASSSYYIYSSSELYSAGYEYSNQWESYFDLLNYYGYAFIECDTSDSLIDMYFFYNSQTSQSVTVSYYYADTSKTIIQDVYVGLHY